MEIKLKNNIDFKDIKCGDFIVNAEGELRQIIQVSAGLFNVIYPECGQNMMLKHYKSIIELCVAYSESVGIERIIKSKNIRLEEI